MSVTRFDLPELTVNLTVDSTADPSYPTLAARVYRHGERVTPQEARALAASIIAAADAPDVE